ncbi:iron-sulfur cluster carrier protein ApbC [Glaciecola sp. MH2013]|uniref:iron-sulfur cluster carrier protein ApbC n=1 Tax=Glaciecola sp. MH2013 TaxID=2785524 RepID=UPI00189EEE9C|nr:iron-sulfur cluster carrier protein ApbC [Glaciecola sp. MH2013]MBF7073096.1 iron-sulfur cluster carrier protein ApbC [Glaciecola sp. MH2013]
MLFSKSKLERNSEIQQHILDFFNITELTINPDAVVALASSKLLEKGKKQIVEISLGFVANSSLDELTNNLVDKMPVLRNCEFKYTYNVPITAAKATPIPNVKNVIAVSSGKGGVGKSATSVNLAYALQAEGARVGILDADIYGPSVPIMLGNPEAHPQSEDNRTMYPINVDGVVANSIGYLVDSGSAAIWRGPMATKALKQLIYETKWPLLDYLIVDLPPGTGDIHLTLAQQVPLSAAVIVTTPQTIATADAKKGIAMFEKLNIPVLGIVENMSYFECACGEKSYPFSQGGSQVLAKEHNCDVLAELPLSKLIREHADAGKPLIIAQPDQIISRVYQQVAQKVSVKVGSELPLHTVVSRHSGDKPELVIPIVNQ